MSKKEGLQKEFDEQLEQFIKDESYFTDYDKYQPIGAKILVKLFKFTPAEPDESLGKTSLYIQSNLDNTWRPSNVVMHEKVYPIIKVIKVGMGNWGDRLDIRHEDVEPGMVFTVPYNDIVGVETNQEFLHLVQTFAGKAGSQGKLVNIPQDIPQKLPKVDVHWSRYKFSMPDRLGDETEDDKLVYLIPALKLESIYK